MKIEIEQTKRVIDIEFPCYLKIEKVHRFSSESSNDIFSYYCLQEKLLIAIDLNISKKTKKITAAGRTDYVTKGVKGYASTFSGIFTDSATSTFEEFDKARKKAIKFLE